jgi:FixJ family two-component response regulator
MSGAEVADQLRVRRPGIQVLFVSGYAVSATTSQGNRLSFLQKPYSAADLARRVRRILDTAGR